MSRLILPESDHLRRARVTSYAGQPHRAGPRRRPTIHALRRTATALVVILVAVTGWAVPAQASWYLATTGGNGAYLRPCAWTTCNPPQGEVPAWTNVRIVCQKQGQSVNGYYGTSDLWNYVVWEGGPGRPEGFAADANFYTGHPYRIPGVDYCV